MLEISDLVAGYDDLQILHDVDLHVEEGEYVVVIGPNGAGKTTLLRSIFGFTDRERGSIRFKDADITGQKPSEMVHEGIGYVPQDGNIFEPLSVIENLKMGAYTRGDIPEDVLEGIYERFPRLAERTQQASGTLSGGERKMLAVARALITEPDLLLLDEPSAGLAPNLVDELFDKIDEINADGTTVLMIEQNADEILKRGDRGYVLAQGRIQLEGDCDSLLADEEVRKRFLGGEELLASE